MSRFDDDYDGDGDEWSDLRSAGWQNALYSALRGKRGLKVLQGVEQALLALPQPCLIDGYIAKDGEYCVVGAYAKYKGAEKKLKEFETFDYEKYDPPGSEETCDLGESVGMQRTIAWTLANMNDEECRRMTPEQRFDHILMRVRKYIAENPYVSV